MNSVKFHPCKSSLYLLKEFSNVFVLRKRLFISRGENRIVFNYLWKTS